MSAEINSLCFGILFSTRAQERKQRNLFILGSNTTHLCVMLCVTHYHIYNFNITMFLTFDALWL